MDKIGEWQLEKYARMTVRFSEEGKEWKTLDDSPTRPLALNLTKAGILTVQVGRLLQEYWNLLQVKGMKIHTRGDCMIFLCRAKEDVHRWRVKFAGGAAAGEIRCNTCARAVNSFLVSPKPVQPSLQGLLQPAPPTASLQGLQLGPSAASLSGLQPAPSTASLSGLQPAPPTTSLQGLQHPALSLSGLHSTPSAFQPVPPPPAAALPRANMAHASGGINPSNTTLTPHNSTAGESTEMVTNSASKTTTEDSSPDPAKAAQPSSLKEIFGDSNLEQLVRNVLLDPGLPDLVEAVHKVISDM